METKFKGEGEGGGERRIESIQFFIRFFDKKKNPPPPPLSPPRSKDSFEVSFLSGFIRYSRVEKGRTAVPVDVDLWPSPRGIVSTPSSPFACGDRGIFEGSFAQNETVGGIFVNFPAL